MRVRMVVIAVVFLGFARLTEGQSVTSITCPGYITVDAYSAPVTFTLSGPAPIGGATIFLDSTNPAAATVSPSIVVPAGSTGGTFYVTGVANGTSEIGARGPAGARVACTVDVGAAPPSDPANVPSLDGRALALLAALLAAAGFFAMARMRV